MTNQNKKQLQAFMIWFRKYQKLKKQEEERNEKKILIAQKLIRATESKMKKVTEIWRKSNNSKSKISLIKNDLIKVQGHCTSST